jgi:hypothetical protein
MNGGGLRRFGVELSYTLAPITAPRPAQSLGAIDQTEQAIARSRRRPVIGWLSTAYWPALTSVKSAVSENFIEASCERVKQLMERLVERGLEISRPRHVLDGGKVSNAAVRRQRFDPPQPVLLRPEPATQCWRKGRRKRFLKQIGCKCNSFLISLTRNRRG